MIRAERVDAAAFELCMAERINWEGIDKAQKYTFRADASAALSASDALLREGIERALFKIEGIHHIHGTQCLCGFESHRSRSRTEHITGEIRKAFNALLGEGE